LKDDRAHAAPSGSWASASSAATASGALGKIPDGQVGGVKNLDASAAAIEQMPNATSIEGFAHPMQGLRARPVQGVISTPTELCWVCRSTSDAEAAAANGPH
jgi:hypothetical protein